MARILEPIREWTVWDPIPGRSNRKITPRLMTIHTAVTNSQDIYGPGLGPGRTHSHFYNPRSGTLRQHQEIDRQAFADGQGNSFCVSVEHWDGYPNGAPGYWRHGSDVPPLTDAQIENDARLFAHLVKHFGLPNRIATPDNVTGLGWHRLGIAGNFGRYNPADRKTWSRAQTGLNFSSARGKVCPGDRRIDQIPEIWERAQEYLRGSSASAPKPTITTPTTPAPAPIILEDDMALIQDPKGNVFATNGVTKRHIAHPNQLGDMQKIAGQIQKVSQATADAIPDDRTRQINALIEDLTKVKVEVGKSAGRERDLITLGQVLVDASQQVISEVHDPESKRTLRERMEQTNAAVGRAEKARLAAEQKEQE